MARKTFALITDGVLVNLVAIGHDQDPAIFKPQCDHYVEVVQPQIGWLWDGERFVEPPELAGDAATPE